MTRNPFHASAVLFLTAMAALAAIAGLTTEAIALVALAGLYAAHAWWTSEQAFRDEWSDLIDSGRHDTEPVSVYSFLDLAPTWDDELDDIEWDTQT